MKKLLLTLLFAGCATTQPTPCRTASQIMLDKNLFPLKCWTHTYPDTGDKTAKCLVIDEAGREYEKTLFQKYCGL